MHTVTAVIGPSIRIKGNVASSEPLTIRGHVDGTVQVEGDVLTVEEGGRVEAAVSADTIVVCGKIHGAVTARARVVLRGTACVEGDISAPAIALTEGAIVHGYIRTGQRARAATDPSQSRARPTH